MHIVALAIQFVLLVSGLILAILSLREKKPDAPRFPSFNPKMWFIPIRKQKDWFTPRGYRRYLLGCWLLSLGGLTGVVTWLTRVIE